MAKKAVMGDLFGQFTHQQIPVSELMVRGENGRAYISLQTFTEDIVVAIEPDQVLNLVRLLEDAVGELDH
jgi:hypothetical protein